MRGEHVESNRATEIMAQGNVCAESVLLGVCQELGIEVDPKVIPVIAYGFAGGIGNTGSVCGAVAGGVMAIGLTLGRGKTIEEMLQRLGVFAEFRRRFEEEFDSVDCRDLTGLDLTVQEDMKKLMESDVAQTVCFPAVAAAYRIALDVIRENRSS
jgi:C_GCAxxG_C_C family probable redox protein